MAAVCCFDWAEISGSKKDEELKEGRGGRRGRDVLTVHAARSRSSVVGRISFFPSKLQPLLKGRVCLVSPA